MFYTGFILKCFIYVYYICGLIFHVFPQFKNMTPSKFYIICVCYIMLLLSIPTLQENAMIDSQSKKIYAVLHNSNKTN